MYVDSHVHLQPHGEAPPITRNRIELYVEASRSNGVAQIALTEHLFRFREAYELLHGWWEVDGEDAALVAAGKAYWDDHVSGTMSDYVREVEAAKSAGLPVLLGIEMDWLSGRADQLHHLLAPYDWDIVLGSIHWIGAWGFDSLSPPSDQEWRTRDVDTTFDQYGAMVCDLAASGLADVLAHPDLPKIAGHRPSSPTPLHDVILQSAMEAGCALELNANGYNKPCAEPYPAPELLRRAREQNTAITLASDAHYPERVGQRFDDLAAYASAAGYSSYVSYEGRRATLHDLPGPAAK